MEESGLNSSNLKSPVPPQEHEYFRIRFLLMKIDKIRASKTPKARFQTNSIAVEQLSFKTSTPSFVPTTND